MCALHCRAIGAFNPPHLALFIGERRRRVVVERASFCLGDVPFGQAKNGQRLFAPKRPAQLNLIAHAYRTARLASLAVYLDLAAFARALSLRSGFVETRDVQPDVKPDGCIGWSH